MARPLKQSAKEKAVENLKKMQAGGYKRNQHAEKDKSRKVVKCCKKTRRNQENFLEQYLLWHLGHWIEECAAQAKPLPVLADAAQHFLGEGIQPPDLAVIKDFTRFYASLCSTRGRIVSQLTVDGLCTRLEWLFAGFFRRTGNEVPQADRRAVYGWVRHMLTKELLPNGEPVVINVRKLTYNFHRRDIDRILFTIWTHNDRIFIPERYRIQYSFLFWMYCWTGARVHSFFEDGLRWKDVELVLRRQPGQGNQEWRVIYLVKQRYVKNNDDPDHNWFGAAGKDDPRLIYNGAAFLLSMAIADGVLYGISSIDELWQQSIPDGETAKPLRYKPGTEGLPVLRKCTLVKGVQEEPMSQSAFLNIHQSNTHNAGYVFGASIHAIRRALGAAVDKEYTPVERSRHLTQADPRIFGQSYVANVSSVDGHSAILGEAVDRDHIDYFRSVEQFRRSGLPVELPAAIKHRLRQDDVGLRNRIQLVHDLRGAIDHTEERKEAQSELQLYQKRLYRMKLDEYQRQWVEDRDRQALLLNSSRAMSVGTSACEMAQHMYRIMPERERVAQAIVAKVELSREELKAVMQDLVTLCTREQTVLYLPTMLPAEGRCPVPTCRKELNR